MDIAIKQDEFYKNMFENDFITNTPVNTNGNTNTFPSKYIENILMPYTPTKINNVHWIAYEYNDLDEINFIVKC